MHAHEMTFHDCCRTVINHSRDSYARAYAEAGLAMTDYEEVRVQAAYILSNLQLWRGESARNTKARLRVYAK